ncbi:sugar ABC transporter permease [Luedemannella helvata]|uniref:Sugar ABC transporter permease n=1 Tax=Luedemannella helvata TaxID=349315 RepID=A0ABP4XBI2_9ACTN
MSLSTSAAPQHAVPPHRPRPRQSRGSSGGLTRFDLKFSPYLYIAPFFLLFGIFGLYPLIYTAWVSLHNWTLGGTHEWVGFQNYTDLFADAQFWQTMKNTIGIFLLSTVPQLLLALFLATLLNRNLRGRTALRMAIVIPNVTSVAAVAIVFGLLFSRDFGAINWFLGLFGVDAIDWRAHEWSSWTAISVMVDWRWTGYNALIFLAAMQAIPRDLYESAAIDGASQWRQFWQITLPLLRPTFLFIVIVSTIGGLQLFVEPLLFGNGRTNGGTTHQFQTLTMYMYSEAFENSRFGYGSAIAWAMFLLIVVASMVNFLFVRKSVK